MQTNHRAESSSKPSFMKSCFCVILSVIFGFLGITEGIGAIWFANVFVRSQMMNLTNILFITATTLSSILLIILAFRLTKQKWFFSLGFLIIVWGLLSPLSWYLINRSTDRMVILSDSMQPVIESEDSLIVDKLAYDSGKPQRGDIVVFSFPTNPDSIRISRIAGLPGENITIESGQIFIDGIALREPEYISPAEYSGEWQVGVSEYFVLGDHRNSSADSHIFGMVPSENITGKAAWIYLPFSRSGKLSNAGYIP